MKNALALGTLNYIWSHPNTTDRKLQSTLNFLSWQAQKRFWGKPVDRQLKQNIKIRCYPDSYSAGAFIYCGLYDYDEMNFLLRYLRPEDSFADIGANIGIYTLLAASIVTQGQVFSVEALPKNFKRLQENIEINHLDNVHLFDIAVSNTSGSMNLDVAEGDSMPFLSEQVTEKSIAVDVETLDTLLVDVEPGTLTAAKMDIEGAELLALQGAHRLLSASAPKVWILEINDAVKNFGYDRHQVVDLLADYGYHIYHYSASDNAIRKISLDEQTGNNVLAIAHSALPFVEARLGL